MLIFWIYIGVGLTWWLISFVPDILRGGLTYGTNTSVPKRGGGHKHATPGSVDWFYTIGQFVFRVFLWPLTVLFSIVVGINLATEWLLSRLFN